jgi:tetratricopeptide (TPR) repeat protein
MEDPKRDALQWDAVEEATELIAEGRVMEALLALREVIRADGTNPYAFHYLGVALYETKQLEPARDAYRAALRISAGYLGARVALSHVLRELGELQGALAEANEALRRFPKDGEAMHAAGLAHAALGQRAAAKKRLEGFLGTRPEAEVDLEVRQILEMLGIGDEGEAIEFADAAVDPTKRSN